MPELPEVETMVRKLRTGLRDSKIQSFHAYWPSQVLPSIRKLKQKIVGRSIIRLTRRGKYVIFHLDPGEYFLVHMGMSGRLEFQTQRSLPAHVRAKWYLNNNKCLLFCDARKFGRIQHLEQLEELEQKLGLEPLSPKFTPTKLAQTLNSHSRQLKPLLLEQKAVAGLGNIYSDETLYRARIHPLTPANQLSRIEINRLHANIQRVLRQAIRLCGTSFDWAYPGGKMQTQLRVYGRGGEPCLRCGRSIQIIRVCQRSTHFCPNCQKLSPRATR